MARPKTELVLSADEQAQLSTFARSRSLPAGAFSQRARIVLACAAGDANSVVAPREAHERHRGQVASALRKAFA